MAEHVYEGMFLIDAGRYSRDPAGISAQIAALIEKSDGELLASRLWNEQKLAYPINGQRKGTFWLTYFRMDSGSLGKLNRDTRLNDNVLRSLLLKVEPRLVDAMVAHAQGEQPTEGDSGSADADAVAPAQEDGTSVEPNATEEASAT